MPHIAREDKPQYTAALRRLDLLLEDKPKGHLTYVLYMLVRNFTLPRRYEQLSNARACLADASDEFYRLVMAPYEDKVIENNGPAEES